MAPARGRVTKARRRNSSGGGGQGNSGGGRRRPPKGPSQRASAVAKRERNEESRKKAAQKRCEDGRIRKAEEEKRRAAAEARGEDVAKRNVRPKRVRGEKRGREISVYKAGDDFPGSGKTELPARGTVDNERLPRGTRRILALMEAAGGGKSAEKKVEECAEKSGERVKFEGMQVGESFAVFKKRLAEETKQAKMEVAKGSSRKREKKRAFYERRRERAVRRARRRGGNRSDSEEEAVQGEEEDVGGTHGGSINVMVEMLRDRIAAQGKSGKKRGRRDNSDDDVSPWQAGGQGRFGEQASCPPTLAVKPVKRGGGGVRQKRVVVSNAAGILEGRKQ